MNDQPERKPLTAEELAQGVPGVAFSYTGETEEASTGRGEADDSGSPLDGSGPTQASINDSPSVAQREGPGE